MTPADLNAFLLRALRRKSPQTESELVLAAQNVFRAACRTSDVQERLRDLDSKGYVTGVSDGITETTWDLTDKGHHKAKTL
jgi:hypothetical protein